MYSIRKRLSIADPLCFRGERPYCSETLTVFDCAVTPSEGFVTVMTMGILSPAGASSGARTFTWYRFASPGTRPAYKTGAATPPIVTVTVAFAENKGLSGASEP